MDRVLVLDIDERVRIATLKHVVFAESMEAGICNLTEELGELAQAVNDYKDMPCQGACERIYDELLDVFAVCVRFRNLTDLLDWHHEVS